MEGSGLLLFVLCFYLMKLSARVPSIAAKMTNTESGQCILESVIASVKQGIVAGVALIAGYFTAGAGTAVTLAAAAADKVGEVTSGGGGKGEE